MSVKVIVQPNPFETTKHTIEYDSVEYTIQELYDLQKLDVPIEQCAVILNDRQITEKYDEIKPYVDDTVIFKVLPAGEDTWEAIGIGFVAVALFGLGFVTGGATWVLLGPLLNVAIDYFFPPEGINVDPTYSVQGKINESEQYNIVPVVYGTTKMTPSYGGNDYTELVGTGEDAVQYLHQLYVLGYEPTAVDELRIGDSILAEREYINKSVVISSVDNTISDSGFDTDKITSGSRILLKDSINEGEYVVKSVTSTVITLEDHYTLQDETDTISISYLVFSDIYTDVDIHFGYNGNMPNEYPHQVSEATLNKGCFYNIPQYYTTPDSVKDIEIELGFLSGIGKVNKHGNIENYRVDYRIEYQEVGSSTWTVGLNDFSRGKVRESFRVKYSISFPTRGQYNIRVTKLTTDTSDPNTMDTLTWTVARTWQVDEDLNRITPIESDTAKDLVLMALKIKATEQLSGTIDNLTAIVTRHVKDYDSDTDTWVTRESHNPASMFVDALTNDVLTQYPIPFNSSYFDLDTIEAFHTWCEDNNYTCNGTCSSETTLEEELIKICATGRAEFTVIDGKYTIIQEIERPNPVQMFTARNMIKDTFSVTRILDEIPDAVEVQFVNKDIGYKVDTILATDESTPTTTQTIQLEYVDNYTQAYNLARYFLNSAQIQLRSYNFKTSIDAIVATRGDKILVQHDAALLGICSGRIKNFTVDGGIVTSIVVDEECTMELGKEYGITIRTEDDFITYKVITEEGSQTTLYFDESVVDGDVLVGDLFSFGEYSLETSECVVDTISYSGNMECTVSAVEYDSSVFDLGTLPVWTSGITRLGSDKPTVNVSTYGDIDRTLKYIIDKQNNNPSIKIFQSQPTAPYSKGDLWVNNTRIYDCIADSDSSFDQSDWRLRSSSTFDVLNKDTFNESSPEHRWQQIPGNALGYNLLQTKDYSVTNNTTDKDNILVDDDTTWDTTKKLDAVSIYADGIEKVLSHGNFDTAYVVGRYNELGYFGESFTNLLVDPDYPSSQDVLLSEGHVVIQCYRGTITCSYGTASYENPLEFDSSGETLSLTMDDCYYGSVTETDFIPPYIDGSYTADYDTLNLTDTTLQITTEIVNIPVIDSGDTYYLCKLHGDTDNYIHIYLKDEQFFVEIMASGESYIDSIESLAVGSYVISIDFSDGVAININGTPYEYTEVGDTYGFSDDSYGFGDSAYGFGDIDIVFATTLDTIDIGENYNNIVTEVEYA